MAWIRLYTDAFRHPKVATLSSDDKILWLELLIIAAENDGVIPPLETLKRLLKRRLDHLSWPLKRLASAGLIDPIEGGSFTPHNWGKRQYKSDVSTGRTRRFRVKRERSQAVSGNGTRSDTDKDKTRNANQGAFPELKTELETAPNGAASQGCLLADPEPPATATPAASPNGCAMKSDAAMPAEREIEFGEFWNIWPRKVARAAAMKAFTAAVRKGVSPQAIVAGARRFAGKVEREKTEEKFIPHAATWLNGERWLEENGIPPGYQLDPWGNLVVDWRTIL